MKQFFVAVAANLVTIAIFVVGFIMIVVAIAASAGSSRITSVRDGSILVVNLSSTLSDQPGEPQQRSAFDDFMNVGQNEQLPLQSALVAVRAAGNDSRIVGILLQGNIAADGYGSGFAALKELREALIAFHEQSKKPVHAYLVNPDTKDYYVASAASTITIDPFGTLMVPGLAAEEMFLSGLFEKYGIGMQVSRVGRFKAAVEPFLRTDMSPENRLQTQGYLGDMWGEVKRAIASSRHVDTLAFQQLVDREGMLMPEKAREAGLVDRVAYFDVVLADLKALSSSPDKQHVASAKAVERAGAETTSTKVVATSKDTASSTSDIALALSGGQSTLPQITLDDYAPVAAGRTQVIGARQSIAIVYAEGDIVDGQGGPNNIGGDALSKELRRVRADKDIRAVVLRVNSPGGSAIASETIQRELALIKKDKPVVVSMGTVAASGGYWISTAATRVFAEPNTITGSIGVFALIPNVKGISNNHGITFDTVKTGRYADLNSISRPKTADELSVIQRGVDAVYNSFIDRVSRARGLTPDSVRVIAEGRVWSGEDAMKIGLVDSIGNLDVAVKSAATLAHVVGDYSIRELPHRKGAAEMLGEIFEHKAPPVGKISLTALAGRDPLHMLARDIVGELEVMAGYNDPRSVYARLPYLLRIH